MKLFKKILLITAAAAVGSGLAVGLSGCKFTEWDYPTFTAHIPNNYPADFANAANLQYMSLAQLENLRTFYNSVVDPNIKVNNQTVWKDFDNYLPNRFNELLTADMKVWKYWTQTSDADYLIPAYYNIMGIDADLANWCYLGMNYLLTDFYNSLRTNPDYAGLVNELPKLNSQESYLNLLSHSWYSLADRLTIQKLFIQYNQTGYPNGYQPFKSGFILNFESYATLFKSCLTQMNEIMTMSIPEYLINPNRPSEKTNYWDYFNIYYHNHTPYYLVKAWRHAVQEGMQIANNLADWSISFSKI